MTASAPSLAPAPRSAPPVTAAFKAAFGSHPAGVTVITADLGAGPVGITASSVASVSAEPAILAFSLAAATGSAAVIAVADTLVVHLLTAADLPLARLFASSTSARFTPAMAWRTLPTGEPLLAHAGFALRCAVLSRTPAGGSLLVAAQVLEVLSPAASGEPLVYHRRAFHALGEHSALP